MLFTILSITAPSVLFQIAAPASVLADLYSSTKLKPGSTPVPLRVFDITEDGRKILTIDTASVQKIRASAKEFALPQGYKQVSSEMQLFIDDGESLDFGLSSTPGEKLKK